jgi:uncharacterized membrane protein YkvA (DUF1232 family)
MVAVTDKKSPAAFICNPFGFAYVDTIKMTTTPSKWRAVLPIFGALAYGVSPLDLVPDLIPILGLTDDAAFGLMMIVWAVRLWRNRPRNNRPALPAR